MESTGGLEIPAAKAIHRAGMAVIIANPRQTHQFAQSQSLTKTDAKDAQMLAFFAQMMMQKEGWQTMLYHPPSYERVYRMASGYGEGTLRALDFNNLFAVLIADFIPRMTFEHLDT